MSVAYTRASKGRSRTALSPNCSETCDSFWQTPHTRTPPYCGSAYLQMSWLIQSYWRLKQNQSICIAICLFDLLFALRNTVGAMKVAMIDSATSLVRAFAAVSGMPASTHAAVSISWLMAFLLDAFPSFLWQSASCLCASVLLNAALEESTVMNADFLEASVRRSLNVTPQGKPPAPIFTHMCVNPCA